MMTPSVVSTCRSGWLRASTWMRVVSSPSASPEMSAVANANARFDRPEPGGPVTSHECVICCKPAPGAEPAASAAARNSAIAASCPVSSLHTLTMQRYLPPLTVASMASEQSGDASPDRGRDLVDGQCRVDHEEPLGLIGRKDEVRSAHAVMEVGCLGLEPVVPRACLVESAARRLGVEIEQDREIGAEPLGRPLREPAHRLGIEHASGPLVGDRRVDVTVLEDHLAALERRTHDGC